MGPKINNVAFSGTNAEVIIGLSSGGYFFAEFISTGVANKGENYAIGIVQSFWQDFSNNKVYALIDDKVFFIDALLYWMPFK